MPSYLICLVYYVQITPKIKIKMSILDMPIFFYSLFCFLTGRVLNRFSKDIGHIDDLLPITMNDFLQVGINTIFASFLFLRFEMTLLDINLAYYHCDKL